MSMKKFAQHIIAVANEKNLPVTNLQLQKVMYFALQKALRTNKLNKQVIEEMYDKPFLVWRYGPVEEDVYETYKVFGSDPIVEFDEQEDEYKPLNEDIVNLLNENPFDLVDKSHKEKYWKDHEPDIIGWRSDFEYDLETIKVGQ